MSIDDEVYAFGKKKYFISLVLYYRWFNFQARRVEDEQIEFMVSISSDTKSWSSRIPEHCKRLENLFSSYAESIR